MIFISMILTVSAFLGSVLRSGTCLVILSVLQLILDASAAAAAAALMAGLRLCVHVPKFKKDVMVNSACVCVCMEDQCTSWSHAG